MSYRIVHCKPVKATANALLLDREVIPLLSKVYDMQMRALHVAKEIIGDSDGRLDPSRIIIVHSDKQGDEKLRSWGREQGLRVLPIFRRSVGAMPTSETLRRILAKLLFSQDPFLLTGPVLSEADFLADATMP